jgi:hypothetical protein
MKTWKFNPKLYTIQILKLKMLDINLNAEKQRYIATQMDIERRQNIKTYRDRERYTDCIARFYAHLGMYHFFYIHFAIALQATQVYTSLVFNHGEACLDRPRIIQHWLALWL